jgi:hypothetical protein
MKLKQWRAALREAVENDQVWLNAAWWQTKQSARDARITFYRDPQTKRHIIVHGVLMSHYVATGGSRKKNLRKKKCLKRWRQLDAIVGEELRNHPVSKPEDSNEYVMWRLGR